MQEKRQAALDGGRKKPKSKSKPKPKTPYRGPVTPRAVQPEATVLAQAPAKPAVAPPKAAIAAKPAKPAAKAKR